MSVQVCPRCEGRYVDCTVCGGAPPPMGRMLDTVAVVGVGLAEEPVALAEWLVQGVDLSGWNGVMDISVTKTKCQYGIIRLGYGNNYKDYRCDTYRTDFIANDMPYGVYWYVRAGENWQAHADSFASVASQFPYQLDLVMDVEYTTLNPTDTLNWLKSMDGRLRSITGKIPMIYSRAGFWDSKVAPSSYWNNHRKWVANWTNGAAPYMPDGWSSWNHWQWSADGNGLATEYGMVSDGDYDMDLDRFNGTVESFNSFYGTRILPIGEVPPPPPSEQNFEMVVIVDDLNVRDGPGTSYPVRGQLHLNDVVKITDISGSSAWIRIKEGQFAGKWAAVKTSIRYMQPND